MKITKSIRFGLGFNLGWGGAVTRETIAVFGRARLVLVRNGATDPTGRHELIGGTAADRVAAREWCSLFAHEVIFKSVPGRNPGIAFAA